MDTYGGSTPPGPNPGTNPHDADGNLIMPSGSFTSDENEELNNASAAGCGQPEAEIITTSQETDNQTGANATLPASQNPAGPAEPLNGDINNETDGGRNSDQNADMTAEPDASADENNTAPAESDEPEVIVSEADPDNQEISDPEAEVTIMPAEDPASIPEPAVIIEPADEAPDAPAPGSEPAPAIMTMPEPAVVPEVPPAIL
jgi:hypothetical protein